MPDILWRIIDTLEFQRLRLLKQVGAVYLIYPGAQHTRFEHSIGVAYLGLKWIKILREKQPELNITTMDVLCVAVAGLCHDLGHGPFSHVYDHLVQSDYPKTTWQHEKGSALLFEQIIKKDAELTKVFGKEIDFIKELILGKKIDGGITKRKGRPKNKSFLYEIINNERCGFDVDKLDYMLRDGYYCGVSCLRNTVVERWFSLARAYPVENDPTNIVLCLPDKSVYEVFYDVFQLRVKLHQSVYQQQKVQACELMLMDIMRELANSKAIKYKNNKGQEFSILEAHKDMDCYIQTSDSVLEVASFLDDPSLKQAKILINRLKLRDIYKSCGRVCAVDMHYMAELPEDRKVTIANELVKLLKDIDPSITTDDFIVNIMRVHHGMGNLNPINEMYFYSKGSKTARKINIEKYGAGVLPAGFSSPSIRIFSKEVKNVNALSAAFKIWGKNVKDLTPLCSQDTLGSTKKKTFTFSPVKHSEVADQEKLLDLATE